MDRVQNTARARWARPRRAGLILRALLLLLAACVATSYLPWAVSEAYRSARGCPAAQAATSGPDHRWRLYRVHACGASTWYALFEAPQSLANNHTAMAYFGTIRSSRLEPVQLRRDYGDRDYLECGWPFPSIACSWTFGMESGAVRAELRNGIPLRIQRGQRFDPATPFAVLPVGILWRGMALNAAIAAGAFLLVLAAARLTARVAQRRRRSRGDCPRCAYPLPGASAEVCPECGASARQL